tara:strand:- start:5865 stop:7136 length:1272 start_codon:yes stop_codon:yes gene_type:complete
MKNIFIKNKITVFIFFNIFFAIFYLFLKHNVGNDTSISEWLINYKGGFTRRGFGGLITFPISNYFSIPLRESIFYIQSFLHCSYLILFLFYMRNFVLNIFQIFTLFSPLFLLYPIAEIESLGRKEILLLLFFVSSLLLSEKKFSPKILNYKVFILFPILCLVWEEVILFSPFLAVVLVIKNNLENFKKSFFFLLIIFFPTIVTTLFIFSNPLSLEGHKIMCDFLQNEYGERCYMSAVLLVQNTIYFDTLHIHDNAKFFPDYFRYLLIFLVGFSFLHILLLNNKFLDKRNFITKNFKPIYLFILLYLPVILLFIFGLDWGRWIHILYSLSALLYFYLLKNDLISNKFEIQNTIWEKIFEKKIILIFVFYIFAFFWNPKTVITGDIATNTLYKIVYNSSKKIFNYDGIRLFQDNPLIKFHKKYIE